MVVEEIPVAKLRLADHYCRSSGSKDEGLSQSIERHGGLLQPIIVRKDGDGYRLLSGRQRYEEVRRLGQETVAAVIHPKAEMTALEEFEVFADANLKVARNSMDLGEELLRGKRLYEREHGEARLGAFGGSPRKDGGPRTKAELPKNGNAGGPAERYTKVIAEKLDLSESTIKNLLRLAEELPEADKKKLREGEIKLSAALAQLPSRRKKAHRGPPPATTQTEDDLIKAIHNLASLLGGVTRLSPRCRRGLTALAAKINELLAGAGEYDIELSEKGALKVAKGTKGG